MQIKIIRPGKAKQTGPNRNKMIFKRPLGSHNHFLSNTKIAQKTPQDIFQERYELLQKLRTLLG